MALFYFILKTGHHSIPDREGVECPNETAAHVHAAEVARELMRNREIDTRFWRIQVCDEDLRACFEVRFASIDRSIAHLPAATRHSIENVSLKAGELADAILSIKSTMSDVRITLAHANRLLSSLHRRPRPLTAPSQGPLP